MPSDRLHEDLGAEGALAFSEHRAHPVSTDITYSNLIESLRDPHNQIHFLK